MKPGDFAVVRTNGWVAWLIRVFTRSPYNHAFAYFGDGKIIEANPPPWSGRSGPPRPNGVQFADLSKYDGCKQLRSDRPATDEVRERVVTRLRAQLGLEYGFLDVAAIALSTFGIVTDKLDDPDSRFCSQVIAIAWAQAGDPLTTKSPNRVTPGDLAQVILGHPVPANW